MTTKLIQQGVLVHISKLMSSLWLFPDLNPLFEYRELDYVSNSGDTFNFKGKTQMKIITMTIRADGTDFVQGMVSMLRDFGIFHIDIVVSCIDHENDMNED